ncbi:hypothetical protein DPMN_088311 [Dreissena polymorpha]|uniref:Uncharacterized protein n=3 Tax=Dreissena polymorpha TaxID=45954 RepID=A0A9D4QXR8_DREPO|nr:hypothetical protein DPMN_088311 [Dreissena polymorpha]
MLLAVKIGRALIMAGRNPGNQAGRSPSNQAGCDVVNLGISNLPPTAKTDLANRLLELVDVYKGLWMKRYLEHGLKYSQASLQVVLKQFIPEGDPRSQQQEEHV